VSRLVDGSLRHIANPQAGFGVQTEFGMT